MAPIAYAVRPQVPDEELNALFAAAWEEHADRDFRTVHERSLTFVCAFDGTRPIGYVNVAWDGGAHGFVLDPTVHPDHRRRGIGTELLRRAAEVAAERGLTWLHADFEPRLAGFYRACGYRGTEAGLLELRPAPARVMVREATGADLPWVREVLERHWGDASVVTRGRVHDASALPAFVAVLRGDPVGHAAFRIDAGECEIVSLVSEAGGRGAGTGLVEAVLEAAAARGCRRVFAVTTNDNARAIRFYQRRGFRLAALRPGAVRAARELKPSIPRTGEDGIPIRDEIELERAGPG